MNLFQWQQAVLSRHEDHERLRVNEPLPDDAEWSADLAFLEADQ